MGRAYQNRKESMAKTSDQKAKVYSKYGREIYVVAKQGGTDPTGNLSLRGLIERAKKDQVPTHVIEKAIEKAKGGAGEDFAPARYEGYGPGGCMVIVDCLTDNPNRTISEVRNCFTKSKCKLGNPGAVTHMFEHSAIFVFAGEEEAAMDALLEADVDVGDIEFEDGKVSVFTPHNEYANARNALTNAFGEIDFEVDEIQFIPQTSSPVTGDDVEMFKRLTNMLDDCDDVQNVWHNGEL